MELNITGRHAKLSPQVKAYAEEKLEPVIRFDTKTRLIEVVLDHEPLATKIEAKAHVGKGAPIVVHAAMESGSWPQKTCTHRLWNRPNGSHCGRLGRSFLTNDDNSRRRGHS